MPVHATWEDYARARAAASNSAEYRRNRKRLLARRPLICAGCGYGIDPDRYHHLHPQAPTVDHIVEVTDGGHPTALENMQPMHRACNEQKERERRARLEGRTARPLGERRRVPPRVTVADVESWVVEEDP